MAKKLTIRKSKLSKKEVTDNEAPEEPKEKLNLLKGEKSYPRSYRWRGYDLEMIEKLIKKANDVSRVKIDATKVLRGAMLLADKKSAKQLLEAIMDAEKKSILSKIE